LRYERDGFSVEAAFKKKRKLPDDHWYWDQPPEVWGAEAFEAAYRDLVSCRPPDGPIPWTAVMAYADREGLPRDLANALWVVIKRIDMAERQWRAEETNRESGG
jgi:hypothetical protein